MEIKSITPRWSGRSYHFEVALEGRDLPDTLLKLNAEELLDYDLFQKRVLMQTGRVFTPAIGDWSKYIDRILARFWENQQSLDIDARSVLTEDHRKELAAACKATCREEISDSIINVNAVS